MERSSNVSEFYDKHVSLRIVVSLTCGLSMLGSLLIIFSYMCVPKLRSQGRVILVHLAAMDFTVALSNVTGAIIDFDKYYINITSNGIAPSSPALGIEFLCKLQGGIAHFSTISSVLWTAALAVYMYIIVRKRYQNDKEDKVKRYIHISGYICYGIPTVSIVILYCMKRLGHSPEDEAAWCGIIQTSSPKDKSGDILIAIFGYDIWIYLTACASLFVFVYIIRKIKEASKENIEQWKEELKFLDKSLLLIPVFFILLRMWSGILNILLIYIDMPAESIPRVLSSILIYLSGIGDSGQGAVNGLLFTVFPQEVRRQVAERFTNPDGQQPVVAGDADSEKSKLVELS